jgi:hypothetical protein
MPSASNSVRVALLDRFAPAIEATLEATLPEGWDLIKVGTTEYPDSAAAIGDADVVFIMGGLMANFPACTS